MVPQTASFTVLAAAALFVCMLLVCASLAAALRRSRAQAAQLRLALEVAAADAGDAARHARAEQRRLELQHECQLKCQLEHQLEYQLEYQRFARMLSHEFRTPLAIIDGALQNLDMTSGAATEASRQRYRKMAGALEQLLALIDDYLSPQRMASIGRAAQSTHLCPRELLESALAQHELVHSQHEIALHMDALPALLRCEPDATRLCLQLLLGNAAVHTPPGSHIVLRAQVRLQGGIEIVVQDDGPGVASHDIAHVFDNGYSGSSAQAGAGLGLYIARSIIEAQGGTLTLESVAGGGAAFKILLPTGVTSEKFLASDTCSRDNSVHDKATGLDAR